MWKIINASDNSTLATVTTTLEQAVAVASKRIDASQRCLLLNVTNAGKVAAVVTVGRVSYRGV